jgi:hypothetical protein
MHEKFFKSFILSLTGLLVLLSAGCSEIKIDSFQKWCELISGEDLKDKYAKPWVIKISVSVDEDRIRDDFVSFLNRSLLDKVQYKVPEMAWMKADELHIVNLSSILKIAPEIMIDKWEKGLKLALQEKHTDFSDICIYETVTRLFRDLYIHNIKYDENGSVIEDDVTPIRSK